MENNDLAGTVVAPDPIPHDLAGTVEASDLTPQAEVSTQEGRPRSHRRVAVNVAIFSVATGLSRVVGFAREVLSATYFGTGKAADAYSLAGTFPELLRSLLADAALPSAFVPVFTDLLEKRRRREAYELASALFTLILFVLGIVTVLSVLITPLLFSIFLKTDYSALAATLTQILLLCVVLIGVNSLVVGILNAHNHFSIPALAPIAWNLVIIGSLIWLRQFFTGDEKIYAYAIGVVLGTIVQVVMSAAVLRRTGIKLGFSLRFKNPRVRQVLTLMLPVTIALGVINIDVQINRWFVNPIAGGPAAIEKAFRLYMLPQGMFSVAVSTVIFPVLARLASQRDQDGLRETNGNGIRLIGLLLIPSAAVMMALAEPITRLTMQHGVFDAKSTALTSTALMWFALSLPFAGVNLLLTKTFFSIQRPWVPTLVAIGTLFINVIVSLSLIGPFGIVGPVIGTVVASLAMTFGQAHVLRNEFNGLDLKRTFHAVGLMTVASVAVGLVAYLTWFGIDTQVGRSLPGQILSVMSALSVGGFVYIALVSYFKIPEAHQMLGVVRSRMRRKSKS